MAVENERVRKKYKKEHMKTIATLRDLAFKRDPRVLAAKAAEAAQKDELKLKKLEEKRFNRALTDLREGKEGAEDEEEPLG